MDSMETPGPATKPFLIPDMCFFLQVKCSSLLFDLNYKFLNGSVAFSAG